MTTSVIRAGLFLFVVIAIGCDYPQDENLKNVLRAVDSPDGTATAHLARKASGGAAGSLDYSVYLTQIGASDDVERVFDANGDCNPAIQWRSGQLLLIRYSAENCVIYEFRNFWRKREVERTSPTVEIVLDRVPPVRG